MFGVLVFCWMSWIACWPVVSEVCCCVEFKPAVLRLPVWIRISLSGFLPKRLKLSWEPPRFSKDNELALSSTEFRREIALEALRTEPVDRLEVVGGSLGRPAQGIFFICNAGRKKNKGYVKKAGGWQPDIYDMKTPFFWLICSSFCERFSFSFFFCKIRERQASQNFGISLF